MRSLREREESTIGCLVWWYDSRSGRERSRIGVAARSTPRAPDSTATARWRPLRERERDREREREKEKERERKREREKERERERT